MLTFAICDDDYADIERISNIVIGWGNELQHIDICVKSFTSPYLLLDEVSKGVRFDAFFLDILMPEMTGISLGEHLSQVLREPMLIYLSSSEDYYSDAFRLYAFQYICKPIHKSKLNAILDRVLSRCEKQKRDIFILKTAQGVIQIPLHTIVYVELLAHICYFHLSDGSHLKSLYLRTSFDHFIKELMQQDKFVKTHTSFVVNLDFASKLTASVLSLESGESIPVTRSFAGQVHRKYITYGLRGEERL